MTALTKSRSNGPLAEAIEARNGSIKRVFANADLPLSLIEHPELLVPLRDQISLLEYASREVGDEAFSARLASEAGVPGLGVYGNHLLAAPTLAAAIARANSLLSGLLQSSTSLLLDVHPPVAFWSYDIGIQTPLGRQKHDLLAITYMMDLLRRFVGPRWIPLKIQLLGPTPTNKKAMEEVLSCDITSGTPSGILFPSQLLDVVNLRPRTDRPFIERPLPDPRDTVACAEHLIKLALLEGRPRLDWVAKKMELSGRSLQRHLAKREVSFYEVLDRVLTQNAAQLLEKGMQVTEVAVQLGYSDGSHLGRAFRRWTGITPGTFYKNFGISYR